MSLRNGLVRVGTAVVGIPIVVGAVYLGGWTFAVLVILGSLVSQHEVYSLLDRTAVRPLVVPGLAIGLAVAVRALIPSAISIAILCALGLTLFVFLSKRYHDPWRSVSATLSAVFYPTLLITYIINLRVEAGQSLGDEDGFWLTITVFLLVWVSDTAAYYVGKSIGRRPLAPTVSPKKTWEGSVGGAVASILVALILWKVDLVALAWFDFAVLGLVCGTVGQLGDLAESRLKRVAGVKDSGSILPGHGGLLDRLDAMIVAVPIAYLYLALVANVI